MNAEKISVLSAVGNWSVTLGFALAALCAIAAVFSGVGYQMDIWHFRTGFQIIKWSFFAAVAALVLAGFGLAASEKTRTNISMGVLGLIIAGVVVYVPTSWKRTLDAHPYIHDISTDLESPPEFIAVAGIRGPDDHPVSHDGPEVAEKQRKAYPDLQPWTTNASAKAVFDAARKVVLRMGMKIVDANESGLRIEATATTLLYGFSDDVVVRIVEVPEGSRIDVRSKSRVGLSDLGQNAKRIRTFLTQLKAEVGG